MPRSKKKKKKAQKARKRRSAGRAQSPNQRRRIEKLGTEFEKARAEAYDRAGPEGVVERTVKVVAEGDSWFSYFPANDVLACLRRGPWDTWTYEVADRAKAGALLNDMVYGRDMADTYELLEKHRPEVFLFSGGGNDIAGQELFVMLYHHKAVQWHGGLPEINKSILRGLVSEVFQQAYSDLIRLVRWKLEKIDLSDVPIILHGYDYAIPDGRGWGGGGGPLPGPWLDPCLSKKGYDRKADKDLRRNIVRELIDAFNDMQKAVVVQHANTHHVDLRGKLPDKEWANELHPTKDGFKRVTREIEKAIRAALKGRPAPQAFRAQAATDGMTDIRIRRGTKAAVGVWSARDPATIFLDMELDLLQDPSNRPALRHALQDEFFNERGFPIPLAEWQARQSGFKTVGDVRDYVKERNA